MGQVIDSFNKEGEVGVGLPLGNLTSQLLVNIYMNDFDQFAKHKLKIKYYIRYADDFVIFHENRDYLENIILEILKFLQTELNIYLNLNKVFVKTLVSGVDFLGWVNFSHHRVLRTTTKRRMLKCLTHKAELETVASYLGLLSHGNAHKLSTKITELEDVHKEFHSGNRN